MKKGISLIFVWTAVLLTVFTLCAFTFRNLPSTPVQTEHPERKAAAHNTVPVNINTASVEELMTLPGIGETFARRIVEYRETFGPFDSVTDLLAVEGIGTGRLEAILDLIETGGQHENTGR